ncbi:MAG TPA: serine hydrolase domain-containing protein, partial [Steroidobacteraceae bacterium]|nr:serine hydrolase domain-containing protein [Steroidobacteraceae bacterium]
MRHKSLYALVSIVAACVTVAQAATHTAQIDATVEEWLRSTGVPSVSIAVVENGAIAYVHAYGKAQLSPPIPATPASRYAIASNSKEFTAAALLILAEQGKLSLDDPVSKWFPDLGPASHVSVRQLLTHTSGIRDYWPQDFVPPEMLRPTSVTALLNEWARRPLDFAPGTDWQYSNTGYVLAGAIAEKAAGQPLVAFLQEHVFAPLKMNHVTEDDTKPLPAGDAVGYTRYGLGPPHRAPKEAPGWLYAAGELAMTAGDLALWDVSLIDRSLLSAKSYEAALTPVTLADGTRRDYGLGLDIQSVAGRNRIGHTGEASGFLSANRL